MNKIQYSFQIKNKFTTKTNIIFLIPLRVNMRKKMYFYIIR